MGSKRKDSSKHPMNPNQHRRQSLLLPSQAVQLLSQFGYEFKTEEWSLKAQFRQRNRNADIFRFVIFADKEGKASLRGIGQGEHSKLAWECASLDLVEQLSSKHGITLPESRILYETRLLPKVRSELHTMCHYKRMPAPVFRTGKSTWDGQRVSIVTVGKIEQEGWGTNPRAAMLSAAYKMFATIREKPFPLGGIQKGEPCLAKLGFEFYDLVAKLDGEDVTMNYALPDVLMQYVPKAILASLETSCFSTSTTTSSENLGNGSDSSFQKEANGESTSESTPTATVVSKEKEVDVEIKTSVSESIPAEVTTTGTEPELNGKLENGTNGPQDLQVSSENPAENESERMNNNLIVFIVMFGLSILALMFLSSDLWMN